MQLLDQAPELAIAVLPLEFANTADWHASAQPVESLTSYAALLAWAQTQQILSATEAATLQELAAMQPAAATAILVQAIELREALYRIFVAQAGSMAPAAADLAILNTTLATALPYRQVHACANGYCWGWRTLTDTLDGVLRPIVLATVQLLTSDLVTRVKQCEDDRGCGFLFLDTSKNRSRRWCSMESCGNRAKVQRHRRRQS